MSESGKHRLWLALVLLASFVAYAPSLGNGFAFDDVRTAGSLSETGEPLAMIHDEQPISEFFRSHYWRDSDDVGNLYRPVTKLTYAWTYHTFGTSLVSEAFPHHLFNVLLNVLGAWLVYAMVRCFAGGAPPLWAALVFGVHAIHSEVVAGIVGRAELLMFCAGAGALLLVVRGLALGGVARAWRLLLASFLFFVCFGAKENGLAWAPFLLVFLVALRFRAGPAAPLGAQLALAAAVVLPPLVAFLWLRHGALAPLGEMPPPHEIANPIAQFSTGARMVSSVILAGYGLGKTLLPFGLCSDYGPQVFVLDGSVDWRFLLSVVVLGAALAGGLVFARRHPLLFLAVAAFFGFYFIVSNFAFPIGIMFAERLFFTPSLGLAFLVAWTVRVAGPQRHGVLAVLLGIWCGYNAIYAMGRCSAWESTGALAATDVLVHPRSAMLQRQAGGAHRLAGDLDGAVKRFEESIRLLPEYAPNYANLGGLHIMRKDYEAAEKIVREGLELVEEGDTSVRSSLHVNLGIALALTGREGQALVEQKKALALTPDRGSVRVQLLETAHGRLPDSEIEEILVAGEKQDPRHPAWALHRGMLESRKREHRRAVMFLRYGLETFDTHTKGWLALATSLTALGKNDEAREILQPISTDTGVEEKLREEAKRMLRSLR